MSFKQWLSLFCFYLLYLFFGATVFYHNEYGLETERRAEQLQERIFINELLVQYVSPNDTDKQNELIQTLSGYCGVPVTNYTMDEYEKPRTWTFFHAFHFSLVVCTTIGYGNISPNNTFGRIFMIFFALIGMPVNGFVFAYMGDYFGRTYYGIYRRYKAYKMATVKNYAPRRIGMIAQVLLYLFPGIIIFIFLPAILFTYFEGWPYSVSVYFAFVTLTTIGFGDYAPTYQKNQPHDFGLYFKFYEAFIIFWVFLGLGYVLMIMTFIAKGMQSKRITRLEHQLSENIKFTQNRIMYGVSKDVGILRRILNEVYLLKVKPVYNDINEKTTTNTIPTSSSCPDLTIYRVYTPICVRKRALSETNVKPFTTTGTTISTVTLNRTQSETDLSRIDRKKTFEGQNVGYPSNVLLAQVVSALGNLRQSQIDDEQNMFNGTGFIGSGFSASAGGGAFGGSVNGIHGFSDSQILASERDQSDWSLPQSEQNYATPPRKPRERASSDFHIPMHDQSYNHEWTWSGDNEQIQEFIRMRTKENKEKNKKSKDLLRSTFAATKYDTNDRSVILNMPDYLQPDNNYQMPAVVPAAVNSSFLRKINPFKKRITDSKRNSVISQDFNPDYQKYLDSTAHGRESRVSVSARQLAQLARDNDRRRQSVLSTCSNSNAEILEKTTIADLIRALEVHHKEANVPDTEIMQEYFDMPKRKMGTASLTPPKQSYERRTSLRPIPGYTIIYNSSNKSKKSSASNLNLKSTQNTNSGGSNNSSRRVSLKPSPSRTATPPPYESPKITRRRFSVRPTNLSTPPGQAPPPPSQTPSIQATTTLQRRLSLRPSPLARDSTPPQSTSSASAGSSTDKLSVPTQSNTRNVLLRAVVQRPSKTTRQDSVTETNEKNT